MLHFKTYVWLFIVSLCFTAALFGLAKSQSASNEDLANAGAEVTLVGCRATNTQGRVLYAAIDGNLQALNRKYKNGNIPEDEYLFSKLLLEKNLKLVKATITDCVARAENVRESVDGQ